MRDIQLQNRSWSRNIMEQEHKKIQGMVVGEMCPFEKEG